MPRSAGQNSFAVDVPTCQAYLGYRVRHVCVCVCVTCAQGCVQDLRVVVFDEADNILDMGFRWLTHTHTHAHT